MNRSWASDREPRHALRVLIGRRCTPLHAIWSVIQTGFGPAAERIVFVTSPTTLMSTFVSPTCVPGGYETG